MNNNNFKIIITGRYKKNIDVALAAEKIGVNSDITPTQAIKLITSKQEKTLHTRIEHKKAYRLKRLLNEAGIEIKLEPANIYHSSIKKVVGNETKRKRFKLKNLFLFKKKKT